MGSAAGADKTIAEKLLQAGSDLGVSDWLTLERDLNQAFADLTGDPVAMQMDGQSYAHGFLTLSLLTKLFVGALRIEDGGNAVPEGYLLNYGFNRMRLIEPIPLGARIRGHFRSADQGTRKRDAVTVIPIGVHVEIENNERPALIGEWLLAWRI